MLGGCQVAFATSSYCTIFVLRHVEQYTIQQNSGDPSFQDIQQANLRLADQLTEVGRMCPPFDGLRKWLWQLLNVTVKGIYLWAKFGVEIRD